MKVESPDRDAYVIRSLARGMAVLRVMTDCGTALPLTEIASRTQLPMPTAFRVVRTLVADGFLEETDSGSYGLGVASLRLGFAALGGMDLIRVAEPALRRLARNTNETVNLGILDDVETLYLQRIRNTDLVTADIRVGSSLPAAAASMGKLLLAFLPDDILADRLTRLDYSYAQGPNAIRNADEFRREIESVRTQQWASQDEELAYGLRSIAAPVRDHSGSVIAAVNIAVPAGRWPLDELIGQLLPVLIKTCQEISAALGATPGRDPDDGSAVETAPAVRSTARRNTALADR